MKKIVLDYQSFLEEKQERDANVSFRKSYLPSLFRGHVESLAKLAKPLPYEKNVFPALPDETPERAKKFVKVFNREIMQIDTENVSFSKVHVGFQDDGAFNMEWIENYFRVYFSFEKDEDDTWGMVLNDNERDCFLSKYSKLSVETYAETAKESIEFYISNKKR